MSTRCYWITGSTGFLGCEIVRAIGDREPPPRLCRRGVAIAYLAQHPASGFVQEVLAVAE